MATAEIFQPRKVGPLDVEYRFLMELGMYSDLIEVWRARGLHGLADTFIDLRQQLDRALDPVHVEQLSMQVFS